MRFSLLLIALLTVGLFFYSQDVGAPPRCVENECTTTRGDKIPVIAGPRGLPGAAGASCSISEGIVTCGTGAGATSSDVRGPAGTDGAPGARGDPGPAGCMVGDPSCTALTTLPVFASSDPVTVYCDRNIETGEITAFYSDASGTVVDTYGGTRPIPPYAPPSLPSCRTLTTVSGGVCGTSYLAITYAGPQYYYFRESDRSPVGVSLSTVSTPPASRQLVGYPGVYLNFPTATAIKKVSVCIDASSLFPPPSDTP
ncbi:MAG: hypothetical protein HYT76_04065 [Deltaproteobacteria bacterium]|nr:hypothetical protein [Deltaproteobacteria bacterium]